MTRIKAILDSNTYLYRELDDADFASCGADCLSHTRCERDVAG